MNSEVRSIEVSTENILAAIELSLKSMRLINDNETVVTFDPSASDKFTITLSKETIN